MSLRTKRFIRLNPGLGNLAPKNNSGIQGQPSSPQSPTNPNSPSAQVPTGNPAIATPQVPLIPNRTFMHTPGGWRILSEPVTYSQYPGVIFLEFQQPHYAQLTQATGSNDLAKLNNEINTLLRQPNKKIVLEIPPLWLSSEVSNSLIATNRALRGSDVLVLHYKGYHPQATFLPSWGFFIFSDIHQAAQTAQAGHLAQSRPMLLLPAPPQVTIPSPPSGSYQILKPSLDPAYSGVYFVEFQKPGYEQLRVGADLDTLMDELDNLSFNPNSKIVFDLPQTRFSKEVTTILIGTYIALLGSGKFIFLFPSWSNKAQALRDLEFPVARTKIDAGALAQAQSQPQNTNSVLTGTKIYTSLSTVVRGFTPIPPPPKYGYWQVLDEPIEDPKYQGVYFVKFQLPDYVKMTALQDVQILADELDAIADNPPRKVVLELPDIPMSKDVTNALLAMNIVNGFLFLGGKSKIVCLFPSWTTQANALQELDFDVFVDRDLAGNCALGPSLMQTFASNSQVPNSSGPILIP